MVTKKILVFFMVMISILSVWTQETETKKEHVVYVPYQEIEQLFTTEGKGIYLSYEDYEHLRSLAEKAQQKPEKLPSLVLISEAKYTCKVDDQFLHVDARYTLDVLDKGWHKFPLSFENIGIKKALLNDQAAFLSLNGNTYELLFDQQQPGKQKLEVSFVVPIKFGKTMDAKVHFKVPRSPIANLELTIPRNSNDPKIRVDISPSLTNTTNETDNHVQVTSLLGNTEAVSMSWQSEAERKVEIKQIVHAENISMLKVGENFLNLATKIKYDVIQGKMNNVAIQVPNEFTVFSVKSVVGQGINDWSLDKEKNLLNVNFLADIQDSGEGKVDLELEIKLEKIVKNLTGKFALPDVAALEVEREKGYYTIDFDDLYALKIISRKDISQLDTKDLPGDMAKDVKFAFKYLKKPYELEVELTKVDPEYEVFTNVSAYLEETIYKLYATFTYNIEDSRIFQTQIQIPEGFMSVNVSAHDLASSTPAENQIKEHSINKEKNLLLITFKKGMKTKNLVIFTEWQKKFETEEKEREINLPVFKVDGAKIERGNIGLGVKSSFNITTVVNSQNNVFPLDINQLFKEGNRPPSQKIDIGFSYHGHPIAAKFKIEKRDPFITAEVFDYISISENVLRHDFRIFYTVKYTGVKEFSFTLPEDIAVNVPKTRVADPQNLIKEIDIQQQEENKTRIYKISTQRDVLGDYEINVSYEEKLKQVEEGKVLKLNTFELITQNTKRENGFIVFKKNNNLSLDFSDVKLLETTDINDPNFSKKGDKTDVLTIFKYFSHGYELAILLQKLQFEPVLNTVINRLHISTSVNKDFTSQNEAVVCLVNNRKQFLDFTVPAGSKVTSVGRLTTALSYRMPAHQIDRYIEQITPSKKDGEEGYRVNISSNVKKDQPFVLIIKYNCPIQGGEMKMNGNFQVDPIQFGSIPVTNFTWDLGLPTEYQYMNFQSNLVRNYHNYYPQEFGIWRVLLSIGDVDKAVIKQDTETGVIPIYEIQGKLFSFSRLSGDGYINVEYMHNNWVYTLYLLVFLAVWFIVAVIPKIKIISRINLSLFMVAIALLLSTLDLQGYGYMYISILYGIFAGVSGAFLVGIVRLATPKEGTVKPKKKGHTLYRDEKKSENEQVKESSENSETAEKE